MESLNFGGNDSDRDYELEEEADIEMYDGSFIEENSDFETYSVDEASSQLSDFSMNNIDDDNYHEQDITFYDDEDIFTNTFHRKELYQVDYSAKNISEISEMQSDTINQVSTLLELKREDAVTLLRFFDWNREKLVEKYMDSPDEVLDLAGISITSCEIEKSKDEPFTCEICYDDDPNLEVRSLTCGHTFCKNCFAHYTTQKVQEAENKSIQCPQDGCNIAMNEKAVAAIVENDVYERYKSLLTRFYVDANRCLRWCPAPNCEYAIECHIPNTSLSSIVPTVICHCGNSMCFGCGQPNHQPAICSLVKKWIKKCEDDSETVNWIVANTKDCEKCHLTIEKNGGCNHMTCRKCRYQFCWVCMGPWSEHGSAFYNCNRFSESNANAKEKQSRARASLQRYKHFYNRYMNHEESAKLDQTLYIKTEKKMEEMQNFSNMSWIEVQFLKKAVDVTVKCRTTLKWTYVFAFYLEKNNETTIFEDNQRDLELATEQLSELLEAPIEEDRIAKLRQEVLDKSVYVNQRNEIVLEDVARGLQEGRWKYNVDINC